jgi:RimJ/RimL family protein N-acetyltransferase
VGSGKGRGVSPGVGPGVGPGPGSGAPWLVDRPDEHLEGGDINLCRANAGDLEELVEAVNDSLEHLRPWMPWAQQPATPESIGAFLQQADATWREGREFQFAIRGPRQAAPRSLIGFCGLHDRVGAGALEIGYWVRVDCTGRGVATGAATLLAAEALALEGVTRVEIRCDEGNVRSAAIPPRLGFRLDRVEDRSPEAPGESQRLMIWTAGPDAVASPPGGTRS